MAPTRRQFLGTAAIAAALAGCGGANNNGDDTTTTDSDATVSVRDHDDHGDILVGPDGMTLYMFVPDGDADGSTCYDGCASTWPPLTIEGSPTAGSGVTAALSTITRDSGDTQVVAGEWPLYYYAGDDSPGEANGQDLNDAWYVLGPDGTPRGMSMETPEPTTTEPPMDSPTVQVRTHDDLGEILAGPDGMTLYMFDNDTNGAGESSCTGGCTTTWPPLTVDGDPSAGDGVAASLSTFERGNGETHVTAGGWPLYHYAGDSSPGGATGQGANDVWYVLRPDGTPVRGGQTTTTENGGPNY